MSFTILADFAQVLTVLAVALLPVASLASVPAAWDSDEPARALAVALALGLVAFAAKRAPGRKTRRAALVLAAAATLVVLGSAVNGFASGLFGVPGRLQGVLSLFVLGGAGAVGALVAARRVRVLMWALAATTIVQVALMTVQSGRGQSPVGTLGNGVPVGAFLAVAGSVLLAGALTRSGGTRLALGAAAFVAAAGVGLSGSRGALLGLVVGVAVAVVGVRTRPRSAGLVVVLVTLALAVGVFTGGGAMTAKVVADGTSAGSADSRLQIWRGTAEMIADHPLLGVGAGRFLYAFPAYQPLEHALIEEPDRRADQAHSLPMQAAAESGLPAALLLLVVAGLALAAGIPAARRRDGAAVIALAGFSAYCVQAIFGVPSLGVDVLGWALGGILLARGDTVVQPSPKSGVADAPLSPLARAALVSSAVVLAAALVFYIAADSSHARGVAAFERGEFANALDAEQRAVARNPFIDVYRVGAADAATYLGPDAVIVALATLDAGLELEPDSYDLRIARARLLSMTGAAPEELGNAYRSAVEAYPLGVTVNQEALAVFVSAGARADAAQARETLRALGYLATSEPEVTP